MTPKQAGFAMPAEWHPHKRCWMAWPCHRSTWEAIGLESASKAYASVINAIIEHEPVVLLVNPQDEKMARKLCDSRVEFVNLGLNDSWTRDTGPSFLLNAKHELAAVRWRHNAWGENYSDHSLDDQIAGFIIEKAQARRFSANLVMEGGAFHVDGEGTLLTTRECLLNQNRNKEHNQEEIETYLGEFLGCEKIIWLGNGVIGDETDGHIDEIACFIQPGEILTLSTSNKKDENYFNFQENLSLLEQSVDARGRALKVHRVEQPPATFLNGKRLTLSYINFYRANHAIIMPSFGYGDYDSDAYHLFTKLFPKMSIVQIPALDLFSGGGGIHCITQQEPL